MNKEQTAVEWLIEQFELISYLTNKKNVVRKALEMEKEQIINAVEGFPLENRNLNGIEYYNKTYKK